MNQQIGLIGLGKMGFPLALNMQSNGYQVTAYDVNTEALKAIQEEGVSIVHSPKELIKNLSGRRVIWLMIPAGKLIDETLEILIPQLSQGDILIDGGNSNFKDTLRRHQLLEEKGINYLDCGTSGGVSGARYGVCTMIGGKAEVFQYCEALFKSISVEKGYTYAGKGGSGHFVKMVHNGIEYGMMQAIAEGFELMERSEFDLDLRAVAEVWNHGSVIRSWLIELTESALSKDAKLDQIKGVMNASGEGQWTVETAIEQGVPVPVIALSLMMRHRSQSEDTFSGKIVAALRNEFGGHKVEKQNN